MAVGADVVLCYLQNVENVCQKSHSSRLKSLTWFEIKDSVVVWFFYLKMFLYVFFIFFLFGRFLSHPRPVITGNRERSGLWVAGWDYRRVGRKQSGCQLTPSPLPPVHPSSLSL